MTNDERGTANREASPSVLLGLQPGGDVEEVTGHGLHLTTGKTTDGGLSRFKGGEAALLHEVTGQGGLAAGVAVEVVFELGEPDVVVGGEGESAHENDE